MNLNLAAAKTIEKGVGCFVIGGEGGWAGRPLIGQPSQEGDPGEKSSWRDVTGIIMSTRIHLSMDMCVCALPSLLNQDKSFSRHDTKLGIRE